jgi:uncharacterized membrane protein/uncharacterized BrkB/YihY/UPF0761 family membrane protein
VDAAWEIWDRDRRKAATLLAGALVYRMFVWILPVVLLIVSLLGFVAETGTDTPEDLARSSGIGAYMVGVIGDAAEQAEDSRWILLGLALVGMALAGNSGVRALRLSHFLVWDVEPTKLRRHQWEAVLALLGVTLAAFVLAAGSWKARDISPGLGLGTVLATTLAFTALWTLASWLLPHADAPWWALLPGALLGALGVLAMHLFTIYYLAGKIEHASEMYGSLGAAVAVLIWLSVFCRLIILGAGVNATLWHRRARRARHATAAPSSRVGDGRHALAGAHSPDRPSPGEPAPMGTLTVWKFDTPGGADAAEQALLDLSKQRLISIEDAAIVSWPEGQNRPRTRQLASMTAAGALSGSFWGLLFGLLFFVPLLGVAAGAAAGAIGGSMTDIGIDDEFIKDVQREVTPGTSALFLLSSGAVIDKVKDAFPADASRLIRTNLSDEEEAKLREVFAD